jgi:hypothetical protein
MFGMLKIAMRWHGTKVVKTDMTHPFCVGHHIGVCLDVSIKTKLEKSLVILGLPSLQLVIENQFHSPTLW